jgi:hypothetical protein
MRGCEELMSEAPTGEPNGGQEAGETPPEAKPEFTPITSQDDLNRIIAERVQRERGKYADYKDLKAKAARLDEIEEANKTEAQKAAERLAKAEQTARDAEARALRREIALEHQLGKDDAALLDALTDEDKMRALAARLAAGTGKKSNYVPREGSNPAVTGAGDEREAVRGLFGSGG